MSIVTGAIRSIVVTLSRSADTTAVTTENIAMIIKGLESALYTLYLKNLFHR
jgi:hypothetical protein